MLKILKPEFVKFAIKLEPELKKWIILEHDVCLNSKL